MDEIQESNDTFHELWAMYARGLDGEVVEQTGVLATWAGVQWPMVNVVFLSSPIQNLADLRSRLANVAAYTGTKKAVRNVSRLRQLVALATRAGCHAF